MQIGLASIFQTVNASRFEPSQVFSFNSLALFFDYKPMKVNFHAEFVLYQIVSRMAPIFAPVIIQDGSEDTKDFRRLLYYLFECSQDFDFNDFKLFLDCD